MAVGFSVLNNDETVESVEPLLDISLVERLEVSSVIDEEKGVSVVIDSSAVTIVAEDPCVTADTDEDLSVLYNDDATEMEELVNNISGVMSPDPESSDDVTIDANDEVNFSLVVPVPCVSEGKDGLSVLYSEESGETVGFEEVIASREVTSDVEGVETTVLTSTTVEGDISVSNESFV